MSASNNQTCANARSNASETRIPSGRATLHASDLERRQPLDRIAEGDAEAQQFDGLLKGSTADGATRASKGAHSGTVRPRWPKAVRGEVCGARSALASSCQLRIRRRRDCSR